MKKFPVLLGLIIAVGGLSYFVCYHRAMAPVAVVTPVAIDAELAWLRQEFALTPAQYDRVLILHHAYSPGCVELCTRYLAAHRRLAALLKDRASWSPEMDAAFAEQARLQSECHASMLKYAYDVAACLSPDQSQRYLEMIKLQLIAGDPAGMFAASR